MTAPCQLRALARFRKRHPGYNRRYMRRFRRERGDYHREYMRNHRKSKRVVILGVKVKWDYLRSQRGR